MIKCERIRHLLALGVPITAIAEIVGTTSASVATERWRMNNPDAVRSRQRRYYARQAAVGGERPSNKTIIKLLQSMSYDQIAYKFGISRNVIAGVDHRSKRAREAVSA